MNKFETFGDTLGAFPLGTRVRFVREDDRYPHFIVPRGTTGMVTEVSRDGLLIHVDQFVEGLSDSEEWRGEYQWFECNAEEYERPFEALP
jgi:hypothetical protein